MIYNMLFSWEDIIRVLEIKGVGVLNGAGRIKINY